MRYYRKLVYECLIVSYLVCLLVIIGCQVAKIICNAKYSLFPEMKIGNIK